MARPNPTLIAALRRTAERLAHGAAYRWTHQGACNCGHLAQTLTGTDAATLHAAALQKAGDWAAHARDFCPTSGYAIDDVIQQLLDAGLNTHDLASLERLADPAVLRRLPDAVRRDPDYRNREHVVAYLSAWADLLQAQWLAQAEVALPAPAPHKQTTAPAAAQFAQA